MGATKTVKREIFPAQGVTGGSGWAIREQFESAGETTWGFVTKGPGRAAWADKEEACLVMDILNRKAPLNSQSLSHAKKSALVAAACAEAQQTLADKGDKRPSKRKGP